MEFEGAIEIFVRAFSYLRSWTHPCLAERVEGVWAIRDAPRKRGDYRKEEWIAWRQDPAEVDRIARKHTRGRFFVCAMHAEDELEAPILEAYKALGYRLLAREGFFVRDLAGFSGSEFADACEGYRVERVRDAGLAERLNRAARSRQVLPEHLENPDSELRQFAAVQGDEVAGWVRSVTVGEGAWVSNLFVIPAHRRRGLGSALMTRMLVDDAAAGVKTSVLLASTAGALLYPTLGYERIGGLMILVPPRSRG